MKKSSQKGFTLIELLVVVSIIALLLAVMMPALATAKERAKRMVCSTRLHQDGIAIHSYAADNKNRYPMPPMNGFWPFTGYGYKDDNIQNPATPAGLSLLMTQGYINSFDFFYCPASPNNYLNKENIFKMYQKRYLETGRLADIVWEANNGGGVWYSFSYWVGWRRDLRPGDPAYVDNEKVIRAAAKGPNSPSDTVLVTDNIITQRNRRENNYPYHKIPHTWSNHVSKGQLLGGYVLYNGGNVEWHRMEDLQSDFDKNMKLDFRTYGMYFWF